MDETVALVISPHDRKFLTPLLPAQNDRPIIFKHTLGDNFRKGKGWDGMRWIGTPVKRWTVAWTQDNFNPDFAVKYLKIIISELR